MEYPWISPEKPAIILAPMEGVTDAPMRAFLTERGGFRFCVSEFLRVSQEIPPARVFLEHVPELINGGKTPAGTPVQVQLLGGDPEKMALSALRAIEAGAKAIDLNFGCPAPTVNRHDGGAALLRYPDRIRNIVSAVRKAVPSSIPVSAKLRLGWESKEDIYRNTEQVALGGASWLTIHARTKMQGYIPPAYWSYIGEVRRRLNIPVVANGEIWTVEDFLKCREETGCQHFMLGRGALANPSLVRQIAQQLGLEVETELSPLSSLKDWEPLLLRFAEISAPVAKKSYYTLRRVKQWLRMAAQKNPEKTLAPWFDVIKRSNDMNELLEIVRTSGY